MPGPIVVDPTPSWLKPENASVTDSALTKALRMIGSLIGADNPTAQVMGLMMTEIPGGPSGGLAKAVTKLKERAIKAYHGSPHDFEKFSLEKIGTGEGAQAYGHGLYFAENPAVAAEYRADLQQRPITVAAGKPLTKIQKYMVDYLHNRNIPLDDKAILSVGDAMTSAPFDVGPRNQQTWEKWKAAFEDIRPRLSQVEKPGRTYEVAIHADPDDFLDWDQPLSQQSEKARARLIEAMKRRGLPLDEQGVPLWAQRDPSGESMHAALAKNVADTNREAQAGGAELMRDVGIPGIKYLDQGSRAAGEGSRNYVVFDDKLIDILKKYGLLLPAAGGVSQMGDPNAR